MARRKRRTRLDNKGKPSKSKQQAPGAAPGESDAAAASTAEAVDDEPADEAAPAECDCPRLDPEEWDDIESDWGDIQFVQVHAKALMGVPLGFAKLRDDLRDAADAAGATVPEDAMVLLGPGRFRRPVLLEVEKADPGDKGVVMPGGIAYSKLLPAPWGEIGKQAQATTDAAIERYGKKPDAVWMWYLTCNDCSGEREYETLFIAHYREQPSPSS